MLSSGVANLEIAVIMLSGLVTYGVVFLNGSSSDGLVARSVAFFVILVNSCLAKWFLGRWRDAAANPRRALPDLENPNSVAEVPLVLLGKTHNMVARFAIVNGGFSVSFKPIDGAAASSQPSNESIQAACVISNAIYRRLGGESDKYVFKCSTETAMTAIALTTIALPIIGTHFTIAKPDNDTPGHQARVAVYARLGGGGVAVVTAGHMKVGADWIGDVGGLPINIIARIDPDDRSSHMSDDAISICTHPLGSPLLAISDVGIFKITQNVDDDVCVMPLCGTYAQGMPFLDLNPGEEFRVSSSQDDDASMPLLVAILSGTVHDCCGESYYHIFYKAKLIQ